MAEQRIVVDGVWKRFHKGEVHDSLRDLVPMLVKRLVGRGPKRSELEAGDFWALSDVSFEVAPGETVGIIGPNGAGKSTLLKILNRILRPNRGHVEVRGRVGALIEIAAGFHGDLTGRENVFLQGAILGMRRKDIERQFDSIVEFSGIGDFIDTPVKRYSSGMNARLGFAIAVHIDPEVLLIDEVLSVGDYAFQQRAFEQLGRLAKSGIPVVIVSHQLNRIGELCDRVILLKGGSVAREGSPAECIAAYVGEVFDEVDDYAVRISSFILDGEPTVRSGDRCSFSLEVSPVADRTPRDYVVGISVRSLVTGHHLYSISTDRLGVPTPASDDPYEIRGSIQLNVAPGTYLIRGWIKDAEGERRGHRGPGCAIEVGSEVPPVAVPLPMLDPEPSVVPGVGAS